MWIDLLHWFGGALAVAAIWALYAAYDAWRNRRQRTKLDRLTFTPAPDPEPKAPRQPNETRLSKARFDRNPKLRRVRQYELDEDGANPFRK